MTLTQAPERRPRVAITGMACLFPGAPDVDAYWRNILGKVDATSEPPPESWDPDVYYDPEFEDHDRTYVQRGGYLGALATFEPLRHGIPPVAVGGEPDQWLALQVARDALQDAGSTELPEATRERTSVILGKGTYLNGGNAIAVQRGLVVGQTIDLLRRLHPEHSEEFLARLRGELQECLPALGPETVPGLIPNIVVGRIANRLDLMGPAYTVDAACASSLVAIQHAVRDLIAGDCDLALAGGSQVWMPVATMNLFCRLGALSRRQRLRAFDEGADGTLLGEGIGMIVLKRLDDAVRDGDRVYAVIRGVGVSSDGKGLSVMAPRVEGEELALRRAYEHAGVSPRSVGLIEAHGTATPVGDVTEVQALRRVFGDRDGELLPRCALGSVKSMISHTIPAAGIAGVIKTALALHHRVLPPTLCERPNPKLELERTPFYINTETRPWIHGGAEPRRAGVNAFGFGGINAHAVLEEFDDPGVSAHRPAWDTEVCILEAPDAEGLIDEATRLVAAIESGGRAGHQFTLAQLACTLGGELGRHENPRRLAVVAGSLDDLAAKLEQTIPKLADPACRRIKTQTGIYYESEPLGPDAKVVLVFPGEGSQYPGMLADLCLHFPEARAVFDRIDRLYADHPRGHLLSDWVYPRPAFSEEERVATDARLMELDIAVESVLTANAAVHAVLERLVPRIDAMLGHSTGEHSAAMAAGALDLADEADLGRFCHGLNDSYAQADARHDVPGAVLLAVGADAATANVIAAAAGGELFLAMDNCPHQAVLVGDADAVVRARKLATAQGLMCEELPYDRAVHTPRFAPFAEDLREIFSELPVRTADLEVWSCTTAAPYPDDPAAIRELLVEHWTSPVRFRETIEALHDDGARVFLEAGPRGNMTTFVEDILRGRRFCAVAADNRRRSGVTQLNHITGMLAAHNVEVDPAYLFSQRPTETVEWRAPAGGGRVSESLLGPKMPLSTSWPMLKLSDEALARLGAAASDSSPLAPARAPAAPPPAVPPPALLPAAAAGVVLATRDEVEAAIDDHMQTMQQFLASGADVMHAYLSGAAPVLLEHARRPLLGTVLAWTEETELHTSRTLDLDEDRYLRDHTLGHAVSRTDPDLTALAVMPLAMSLEILAEAGACLLPGRTVTGLRDVRAHRWLAVDEETTAIEVHARRLDGDQPGHRVQVTIREVDAGGASSPVVEGTVLLAEAFDAPPPPLQPAPAGGEASNWAPGELYGEAMFHQPLWQGVAALDVVAPGGATGRLRVPGRAGMLASNDDPEFVLDPVVLDAAGQLVGFWAAQRLERGRVVFPFRLAALDLYAPAPAPGGLLECRATIALQGDQLTTADIDVAGPDGSCWMRLRGWEDKRFDIPDRFRSLASPSAALALSTPLPAPAKGVSGRRLDAQLGADGALWRQVWASRVLSRGERALLATRAGAEDSLAWLAARTAAKEAVAELVLSATGVELWPAEIEILPDEHGVALPYLEGLAAVPIVSLAHAGGEAAALAALVAPEDPTALGIAIAPLSARLSDGELTGAERALVEPLGSEWLLRARCAKEAAAKAVGAARGAPVLAAVEPDTETVLVDAGGARLTVHTRRQGSLVLATGIAKG